MRDDSFDAELRGFGKCFVQFFWQTAGKIYQQVPDVGRFHVSILANLMALAAKPVAIATDWPKILIATKEMKFEVGADCLKVSLYD